MNYYNKEYNFIQSSPAPGLLQFPDKFMPVYYMDGKRAAGFVTITDDGTTVTSCVWDEDAYQAWAAENPEQPETEPEPEPTLEERVTGLEDAIATGLNLYEGDLGNG